MIAARLIPADVSKEVRALLPLWLGCVVVVWAGGLHVFFLRAGFVMYVVGSLALGALSVGHEYTNHTLPLLLSAPTSRRRIFAIKTSVLLAMLLVLAGVALARLPLIPAGREMQDSAVVGGMSFLGGAFLAPWLTMRCRNPIAGAFFALSIPAALLLGTEIFSILVLAHAGTPAGEHVRMEIFWAGMVVVSAIGAFFSWRSFLKLQAIEGSHADLALPQWFSSSKARGGVGGRRGSPVWMLVSKELHLQQLTFMVSALYVAGWVAILLTWHSTTMTIDQPFLILTVVHGAMVALLAGSLASAEERQLGTRDWQLLLPMSTARQWLIKCGVVFGVVIVLGLALPAVLAVLKPSIGPMRINWGFAATLLIAAAVSLYVSSLSASGLKALLIAVPSAFAVLPVLAAGAGAAFALVGLVRVPSVRVSLLAGYDDRILALEAGVLMALLLRFALINHRTIDGDVKRVWRQLGLAVSIMTLGVITFTAAQMLLRP